MAKTHYIFDMDGTVVESMEFWVGTHRRMLEEAGVPVPKDFASIITPLGNQRVTEYILSLGLDYTPEAYIIKTGKIFIEGYTNDIQLKPYAKEVLQRLKNEGHGIHMLSAGSHICMDPCLKRNGVYDLFENIWSVNEFDYSKAEPAIYTEAARRLGVDIGDCVMVDDNLTAITMAKKAGMQTVGILDKVTAYTADALEKTADRFIRSLAEL